MTPRLQELAAAMVKAGASISAAVQQAAEQVEREQHGPPRVVEEPIKAWKLANLVAVGDGAVQFRGIGVHATYGVEEVAICTKYPPEVHEIHDGAGNLIARIQPEPPHKAPERTCSCGFYAMRKHGNPSALDVNTILRETFGGAMSRGQVLLEVELYGRVLLHSDGYRAEKQRVLGVWAYRDTGLGTCGKPLGPQDYMASGPQFCTMRAVCWQDSEFVCAEHAILSRSMYELAEDVIPSMVPVEWNWIDA